MDPLPPPLAFFLLLFSGWINRHQEAVIAYLLEENRVLRATPVRDGCVAPCRWRIPNPEQQGRAGEQNELAMLISRRVLEERGHDRL